MGIFLDYTCCTHRVQSICNISEFADRKIQPQFENIYRGGGGGHRFRAEDFLNFKMSYLL